MSCTTVYFIPDQGPAQICAELDNAWLGAMYVWTKLSEAYLGDGFRLMVDPDWLDKLSSLVEDPRLEPFEIAVLESTSDRMIIPIQKFRMLAEACRSFDRKYPGPSHMLAIADLLESNAEKPGLFGFGFQQTSVSENQWSIHEDDDEGRPFDRSLDMDRGYEIFKGAP